MNAWLLAATVLLLPCLVVTLVADAIQRLVGLELAGVVATVVLLVLAQGFARMSYIDLAFLAAVTAAHAADYHRLSGRGGVAPIGRSRGR